MPTYTARRGWQRVLQTRIPTLFGLGILILGVVAGIVLLGQGTGGFLPRASEDAVPKNIRITNITDTGFSVSFITDVASPGYIEYGEAPNRTNIQIRDDRDQLANTSGSFQTHHITVRSLQPSTQYYFKLGTGGRTDYDNNGQPFTVRTGRAVPPGGEARTAYGTVNTAVGNPADGALVYVTIQGASPLSAQVKQDGTWALPLSSVRSLDLSSTVAVTNETPVKIELQGVRATDTLQFTSTVGSMMPLETLQFGQTVTDQGDASRSSTSMENTQSSDASTTTDTTTDTTSGTTLEDTTALQDEVFEEADSLSEDSTLTDNSNTFSNMYDDTESTQTYASSELDIYLEDDEVVNTTLPEFLGAAPPGGYIQIEVHSSAPYYGVAQASSTGEWSWSPPADLEPGEHTITATFVDAQGQTQRVQRTFIVQAAGTSSLPAFTSTPSGATPPPTPNLIAQNTSTPVPTLMPSPTATPSSTPIATTSAQPVSGSTSATWILLLVAVACFVVGGGSTAWAWAQRDILEESDRN